MAKVSGLGPGPRGNLLRVVPDQMPELETPVDFALSTFFLFQSGWFVADGTSSWQHTEF